MNNNKIHNELYSENLCIICLENLNENLNENIVDICHKCNIKCHKKCINNWYKKNGEKVCPICLKSEQYYLNVLVNNPNINNIQHTNENTNENILQNIVYTIFYNNILFIQTNILDLFKKIFSFCLISIIICMLFFMVIYF